MNNPIKQARQRQGLTQESLAELLDIHPQAILLNEQGVYPTVLPRILDYFVEQGYSAEEFNLEYSEFVMNKRKELFESMPWKTLSWAEFNTDGQHPFIKFREELGFSRMKFAKSFCVHPAYLYKLERADVGTLSTQLKEALLAVGFSSDFIDELNQRCEDFSYASKIKAQSLTKVASGS